MKQRTKQSSKNYLSKKYFFSSALLGIIISTIFFISCEKEEDSSEMSPKAAFTADQVRLIKGDTIQFSDESTNNPSSWSWNFGDGNTSTSQNPTHVYSTAGEYTVELTVENEYSEDTETKKDYITVAPPDGPGDPVTDIEGNTYQTVWIGGQNWMAENLKTTTYNDGTPIALIENDTDWENENTGAYCWYNNDSAQHAETYGAFYNWHAVNTGNLCPDGWHVPTDEEWKALEMELGMSQAAANEIGWRGTNEGSKLAGNADLWENGGLKNDSLFGSSGFSALPGGRRAYHGAFYDKSQIGRWWNSTEIDSSKAGARNLYYNRTRVRRINAYKVSGLSVRCLRD
jgi:uncharacterized protein (TIGR02145 family)